MLATFRRYLNTWLARLFFLVLVGAFGLWGVADVVRNLGRDTSAATVAGKSIEMPEVQEAYRRELAQVTKMLGDKMDPTPEIRRSVAAQAVERLVTQTAMNAETASLGLVVPDAASRQAIYDIPQFRGANGQFDRNQFENVLRNNNYTEPRFLDLLRQDLGQKQLLEAVRAGAVSPDTLTRQVFAFQQEKRIADAVDVPFAAAAAPTRPTEAQIARWYDNHKDSYSTPEYRRIKAVILSPETVGKGIEVSDDELKAAYEQHRNEYNQPERRSVEVILTQDQTSAKKLADQWIAGADWATMQQAAQRDGATAVQLTDATQGEFPAPELGEAVFAATLETVPEPVHTALGWYVLKVTKATAGEAKSLDEVRDQLRVRVVADKAVDLIYDRANKIEDLLAGGTSLDHLPDDLGLAAVTGTLDAQGNTREGKPAPIPGPADLQAALVQAAFQAKKDDAPRLLQASANASSSNATAFYAVQIEEIFPPAPKPLDHVVDAVRADWTRDAIRHEQEEKAAKILAAVKGGQTLATAAAADGLTVRQLPPVGRSDAAEGVPAQLIQPLFALKIGEPTMVETPDGFVVAILTQIEAADPNADPIGYGRTRDALTRALGDDVVNIFTTAVRDRARPRVNRAMLDSLVHAPE
jgi:peptidyl-prolyl cis-trans isomerase D